VLNRHEVVLAINLHPDILFVVLRSCQLDMIFFADMLNLAARLTVLWPTNASIMRCLMMGNTELVMARGTGAMEV